MHYWRQGYFDSLRAAAAASTWADYTKYCHETEQGLRKEALGSLEAFVSSLERASFEERRAFVSWLLTFAFDRDGSERLIPHPLKLRLVEPTLSEWILVEPASAEPYRWIGDREHLEIALDLDPNDQIARKKLIREIHGHIDYASHELPRGYLGNINADLADLTRIEDLLRLVSDDEFKAAFIEVVEEERAAILKYMADKNDDQPN